MSVSHESIKPDPDTRYHLQCLHDSLLRVFRQWEDVDETGELAQSMYSATRIIRTILHADAKAQRSGRDKISLSEVFAHPAIILNNIKDFQAQGSAGMKAALKGNEGGLEALSHFCSSVEELKTTLEATHVDTTNFDPAVRRVLVKDETSRAQIFLWSDNAVRTGHLPDNLSMLTSTPRVEEDIRAFKQWYSSLPSIPVSWNDTVKDECEKATNSLLVDYTHDWRDAESDVAKAAKRLMPKGMDVVLEHLRDAFDADDLKKFDKSAEELDSIKATMQEWMSELRAARVAQSEAEEKGQTKYSSQDIIQMTKADEIEVYLERLTESVDLLRSTIVKVQSLSANSAASEPETVASER